jgi:hypothetical protein
MCKGRFKIRVRVKVRIRVRVRVRSQRSESGVKDQVRNSVRVRS